MSFLGVRLGNEPQLSPADFQNLGALAEDLGYGEIWMTEGAGRDSLTQLTSVAMATKRIVVGTGILPVFSRTPLITAMSAAGLAEVSDGRFILGLGVGNAPAVENSHGVAFRRPLAHLEEAVTIIQRLLLGEEVTLRGKVFNVDRATLGEVAPKQQVPIYLAALGPRMLKMAGALADGVLLSWTASSYLKQAIQLVQEGAVAAGRDPSEVAISGYVRVAVTDDLEAGKESLRQQMAHYLGNSFYRSFFRNTGFGREMDGAESAMEQAAIGVESGVGAIGPRMQEELGIVGNAEECQAALEELRALGLDKPVIAPLPLGDIKASYRRTLTALAP
ncbi:MAG: hypothetical protein BZY88_03945 [SAR202 cluster bacterium Io17-Chloro-G9]|nr:MAG: hypothetical protein BZY88_03945 [SAR202 cluster bacterium Io17-Chloro-G9]